MRFIDEMSHEDKVVYFCVSAITLALVVVLIVLLF